MDSRVSRLLSALKSGGYEPRIFCVVDKVKHSQSLPPSPDYNLCFHDGSGYFRRKVSLKAHFVPSQPRAALSTPKPAVASSPPPSAQSAQQAWYKLLAGAWLWPKISYEALIAPVSDFSPDIIHANDLSTLAAGVRLAKEIDCKIIYDSHEYENSRNLAAPLPVKWLHRRCEGRAIKAVDYVLTVSETIAAQLKQDYKIKKPAVILNTPENSAQVQPRLGRVKNKNDKISAVCIGAVQPSRGYEQVISALSKAPDVNITIIGKGSQDYIDHLRSLALFCGVLDQIKFLEPVAHHQLKEKITIFDFSIIAIQPSCLSYKYALPNKLFESVDAGLPVLVTPLPEVEKFVRMSKCGVIAKNYQTEAIVQAFENMKSFLTETRPHISLKPPYKWTAQKSKLLNIYRALAQNEQVEPFNLLPHLTQSDIDEILSA